MLKTFYAVAVVAAVSAPIAAFAAGPADNKDRGISVVPDKGGAQTFVVKKPDGKKPGGKVEDKRPPIGEAFLVRPPEGNKPGGKPGGLTSGGDKPNQVFVVAPPQGNKPEDKPGGQNGGGNPPVVAPIVSPPQGTIPPGKPGGAVVNKPAPVAPPVTVAVVPEKIEEPKAEVVAPAAPVEVANPPAAAEVVIEGIGSAADLYDELLNRGFKVSILRHDAKDRYLFLVTTKGKTHGYLALIDGPSGKILKEEKLDLAKYYGANGYDRGYGYTSHSYVAPKHYKAPENCKKTGRVYSGGYGYNGYARY